MNGGAGGSSYLVENYNTRDYLENVEDGEEGLELERLPVPHQSGPEVQDEVEVEADDGDPVERIAHQRQDVCSRVWRGKGTQRSKHLQHLKE